jgi:hypothetical protein
VGGEEEDNQWHKGRRRGGEGEGGGDYMVLYCDRFETLSDNFLICLQSNRTVPFDDSTMSCSFGMEKIGMLVTPSRRELLFRRSDGAILPGETHETPQGPTSKLLSVLLQNFRVKARVFIGR